MSEASSKATVGSITMPHKRNPEISEHLGTLARVVRHNTALMAESQVHDHERTGARGSPSSPCSPQSAMAFAKILELVKSLAGEPGGAPGASDGEPRATRGFVLSESVMLALAKKVGKQTHIGLV